jgi:hypothetical protein
MVHQQFECYYFFLLLCFKKKLVLPCQLAVQPFGPHYFNHLNQHRLNQVLEIKMIGYYDLVQNCSMSIMVEFSIH